jgi:two-component sensor histidine kinase
MLLLNGVVLKYILILIIILSLAQCQSPASSVDTGIQPPIADTVTINALIQKARIFNRDHNDSAYFYAQQALKKARTSNASIQIAYSLAIEAGYQRRKGNYTNAVSLGLQAIQIFDSLHMHKDKIYNQLVIADIYKEIGGERGTLGYLSKGLSLAKQSQLLAEQKEYIPGIVLSLNMQGIILRDMYNKTNQAHFMDSAFACYQTALALVRRTNKGNEYLGKLYNNISQVYNEYYKNYPQALYYLQKAVDYNSERKNLNSLSFNYGNISDVYLRMGDDKKAFEYAHKTLATCIQLKAPHRLLNAYAQLTRVNKELLRFDSALYYKEKQVAITDSLTNVQKTGQITEMNTRYETEKKETRIGQLNKLYDITGQRLWYAVSIAVLLAVFLGMMIWQNRRLQKQKAKIAEQSNNLQWLMKELHHRVKNNLQIVSSLLNLQTYRLKDEEAISALKESQLRVQAMSLIHQRLYQVQDVSLVNFKLYLDDLAETLMKAYGYDRDTFDLHVEVDKEFLDVDTVMPLGLLINEILTNSFKYAYQDVARPVLLIKMNSGSQQFQLQIKDNGSGLENGKGKELKKGFGGKLIEVLTKQLKGSFTVDYLQGTSYHFYFPYKEKAA